MANAKKRKPAKRSTTRRPRQSRTVAVQMTIELMGSVGAYVETSPIASEQLDRALERHYLEAARRFERGQLPRGEAHASRFALLGLPALIVSHFEGRHPNEGVGKTVVALETDYA